MCSFTQQKSSRINANNLFINATKKNNNQKKILEYEILKQSAEKSV